MKIENCTRTEIILSMIATCASVGSYTSGLVTESAKDQTNVVL